MLLTIKDLAEQLQIKPSTLYAWASQGKIPCVRIHGASSDSGQRKSKAGSQGLRRTELRCLTINTRVATLTRSLQRRNGLSIIPDTGKPDQH